MPTKKDQEKKPLWRRVIDGTIGSPVFCVQVTFLTVDRVEHLDWAWYICWAPYLLSTGALVVAFMAIGLMYAALFVLERSDEKRALDEYEHAVRTASSNIRVTLNGLPFIVRTSGKDKR